MVTDREEFAEEKIRALYIKKQEVSSNAEAALDFYPLSKEYGASYNSLKAQFGKAEAETIQRAALETLALRAKNFITDASKLNGDALAFYKERFEGPRRYFALTFDAIAEEMNKNGGELTGNILQYKIQERLYRHQKDAFEALRKVKTAKPDSIVTAYNELSQTRNVMESLTLPATEAAYIQQLAVEIAPAHEQMKAYALAELQKTADALLKTNRTSRASATSAHSAKQENVDAFSPLLLAAGELFSEEARFKAIRDKLMANHDIASKLLDTTNRALVTQQSMMPGERSAGNRFFYIVRPDAKPGMHDGAIAQLLFENKNEQRGLPSQ